jgi:hypothetical protein
MKQALYQNHMRFWKFREGVFNLYLLKGHILMTERFAGRIHVLYSKVCILLQDMPTNISLHRYIKDSFILFIYLWFICYYALISPTPQTFPTIVLQYVLRH